MKKIYALLLATIFSVSCSAQNTTLLTGTVTDSDNQTWSQARWIATIVIPGGGGTAKFLDGTSVPFSYTGILDEGGSFPITTPIVGNTSQIVPYGVTWKYCFYSLTSAPPSCFNQSTTGSTFDMGTYSSSHISAPRMQADVLVYAYNATEILNSVAGSGYMKTVDGQQYLWNGENYLAVGGGSTTPCPSCLATDSDGNFAIVGTTPFRGNILEDDCSGLVSMDKIGICGDYGTGNGLFLQFTNTSTNIDTGSILSLTADQDEDRILIIQNPAGGSTGNPLSNEPYIGVIATEAQDLVIGSMMNSTEFNNNESMHDQLILGAEAGVTGVASPTMLDNVSSTPGIYNITMNTSGELIASPNIHAVSFASLTPGTMGASLGAYGFNNNSVSSTGQVTFTNASNQFTVSSVGIAFNGNIEMSPTGTATPSNNFSSTPLNNQGFYWNGTANTSDNWTTTNLLGTGTTPTSTYAIQHSGSSGLAAVSVPNLIDTSIGAGTSPICANGTGGSFTTSGCTGSGGSSVTSVFGRTGTVVAATNDYSVAQVTGASPSASPTFTGLVTAPYYVASSSVPAGTITSQAVFDEFSNTARILSYGPNSTTPGNLSLLGASSNASVVDNYVQFNQGTQTSSFLYTAIFPAYNSTTNCASITSPAVCASASSGAFIIAATATTIVVNTTRVTANSEISVQPDTSLSTRLAVTCNTLISSIINPVVTARTAGVSFTVTIPGAGLVTNPACYSYSIMN